MTAEPPPSKPPGRFSRLVSAPKRLSLPARAAWVTGLVLFVLAVTAWAWLLWNPDYVPLRHALTPGRIIAVLILLILIPPIVYKGLRLWLEGEVSQFSDIDYAWNAGLQALERNGLKLDAIPLFLVLGSPGERQEQALMHAAGLNLRVRGVPEGPAPLHWYANPDRIYLVCSGAGWLSALATLLEKKGSGMFAARMPADGPWMAPATVPAATPAPTTAAPAPRAEPQAAPVQQPVPAGSPRGTLQLDQFLTGRPPAAAPSVPAASPVRGPVLGSLSAKAAATRPHPAQAIRGTLTMDQPLTPVAPQHAPVADAASVGVSNLSHSTTGHAGSVPHGSVPASAAELPALLPPQEATVQLQRLEYVCQQVRRARQPLCGVNGVLTLLPFEMIQAGPRETEELQRAIRDDLTAVQRTLQLRAPVTALVVGLEQERGFRELVRRVGPERAAAQRFGRRYEVRSVANKEDLAALSTHVCGAFEDWIYTLFREEGALTRPGNTRLYSLLCKVRCRLKGRLTEVLAEGFGYDAQLQPHDDPFLFSGCYFAATGETEDRQAFVRGVLDKLEEEQEDVEWTRQALASERRHLWVAYGGMLAGGVLLLSLLGMAVRRFVL